MGISTVLFDLDRTLWRAESPPDWDEVTRLQSELIAPELLRLRLGHFDVGEFIRRFWANFQSLVGFDTVSADLKEPRWLMGPASIRKARTA